MTRITQSLHQTITPLLTGAAVAASTLSSGLTIGVWAIAAGLFGLVSYRASARLVEQEVDDG